MNPNRSKYQYKYVQFTVTPTEKEQIDKFRKKENFKTTSDFVRRVVFDYIRRQEHPELAISPDSGNINPAVVERMAKNMGEIKTNQEKLMERADALEEMKESMSILRRLVEASALSKEREIIIQLLEHHNSLSIRQIQEETKLPEDVIARIVTDTNLFKITSQGRFALR